MFETKLENIKAVQEEDIINAVIEPKYVIYQKKYLNKW